jgi:6-phosphogluconolactonase
VKIEKCDSNELVTILADSIFRKLVAIDKKDGFPVLALSGGNTPKPMYKILGQLIQHKYPSNHTSIKIIQIDERWVSSASDRSNQKMISEIMQTDQIEHVDFIKMPSDDKINSIDLAAEKYLSSLESIGEYHPDISILGMGEDGHIASLFPNNTDYIRSLDEDPIVLTTFVETQNENRISLSTQLILNSGKIIILMTGEKKGITLARAMKSNDFLKYPVLTLLVENTSIYMDYECESAYHKELNA